MKKKINMNKAMGVMGIVATFCMLVCGVGYISIIVNVCPGSVLQSIYCCFVGSAIGSLAGALGIVVYHFKDIRSYATGLGIGSVLGYIGCIGIALGHGFGGDMYNALTQVYLSLPLMAIFGRQFYVRRRHNSLPGGKHD